MGSGLATAELAAAVASAGALGMVGLARMPAAEVAQVLTDLGGRTGGAFGANFLMPFVDRDAVATASDKARLVEFFYGDPDPSLVDVVHAGGALAAWQIGSTDEARAAVGAGCDVVVVQGVEAGGHVRGTSRLLTLLEQVLDFTEVPVVAAGGIGGPRSMAAALAAGASAVKVGTRFAAAAESGAHPRYMDALVAAQPEDTELTGVFSVMWPDAPHRVLRSAIERAQAFDGDIVGETNWGGSRVPLPRFTASAPNRETTGAIEAMPLYAGLSVGGVTHVQPAAEIVQELARGCEELLQGWTHRIS